MVASLPVLLLIGLGLLAVVAVVAHRLRTLHPMSRARVGSDGVQEVAVVVDAGYHPESVIVQQGRPARLNFVRRENGECSEWVVFPTLNIARQLVPFGTTAVEFIPDQAGEFTFGCRFNVCRGRLVVEKQPRVVAVPSSDRREGEAHEHGQ